MIGNKTFTFAELLTKEQVQQAVDILNAVARGDVTQSFAQLAKDRIFTPETMEHIAKVTGQQNDPLYMAYALEHTLNEACK
ncbi:MAG TPA: hypothetical protein VF077_01010 [Nitrospiraceae bacterium]